MAHCTAHSIMRLSTWHAACHTARHTSKHNTINTQHGAWLTERPMPQHKIHSTAYGPYTALGTAHNTAHSTAYGATATTHGLMWHATASYNTQYTTRIMAHALTVVAMGPPHCLRMYA